MKPKKSSRRYIIALAFIVAGLLTLLGWSQTLAYKTFPAQKLALWFPLIVISDAMKNGFELAFSVIQFPLFATIFALCLRRWSVGSAFLATLFFYTVCVLTALSLIHVRRGG